MSWGTEPKRMTEQDLQDFVLGYLADQVFTTHHLTADSSDWETFAVRIRRVFLGYAMARGHRPPAETWDAALGIVWEWTDRKTGSTSDGLPTFGRSWRAMHADDWARCLATIKEAARSKQP